MASILRRAKRLLKASLDRLFEPARDPRQTYTHAYQRQRELLEKVKFALADLAETKERLETEAEARQTGLPELEQRARLALEAGREDLARMLLERQHFAQLELAALSEQLAEVQLEEQQLSLVEARLASRIEAFYARQEVIAARYNAAEAQVRIQEALTGLSEELKDLGQALEQTELRAERMHAKAIAIDSLVEAGVLPEADPSSAHSAALIVGPSESIERRLEGLKAELASNQ